MQERLEIAVTLTLAGQTHAVPGGNVRVLRLSLESHGVEGTLEFVQQDDTAHGGVTEDAILADFVKDDLGTVALSIAGVHSDSAQLSELPKLETRGVIVEREVSEEVYERQLEAPAVLVRRYRVRFVDRARALWSQHFPWSLYTKKTMEQVFDAERGSVDVTYDWPALSSERPMVFLGLRADGGTHFYDFAAWFLSRERGHLLYDHTAGSYQLLGEKPTAGNASPLQLNEVERVTFVFPPVPRSQTRVVNVDADLGARTTIDAPQAATGVYRDVVVRTAVSQQVDDRTQWETSAAALPTRVARVRFQRYPDAAVGPGSALDLPTALGGTADLTGGAASWRVIALRLDARSLAATPDEGYNEPRGSFELDLVLDAEAVDDATARLPAFRAPEYPGYVEGKVLSAIGADDELTYEVKQDDGTSADQYRVEMPLFDKQEIWPSYQPELASGTFYLPAYKTARVLVALEFDRCRIVRNLDWRPGARPPAAGQGQQLMLGKKEGNSTNLLHDYQDEKPVFQILRTNDKDTLLVRLEEGKMTLKVQQQDG